MQGIHWSVEGAARYSRGAGGDVCVCVYWNFGGGNTCRPLGWRELEGAVSSSLCVRGSRLLRQKCMSRKPYR